MALKHSIEVTQDPNVGVMYHLRYRENSGGAAVNKVVDYDTAMLVLGAIEQGREEAKGAFRRAIGVKE